jgi:hypothetical protein
MCKSSGLRDKQLITKKFVSLPANRADACSRHFRGISKNPEASWTPASLPGQGPGASGDKKGTRLLPITALAKQTYSKSQRVSA